MNLFNLGESVNFKPALSSHFPVHCVPGIVRSESHDQVASKFWTSKLFFKICQIHFRNDKGIIKSVGDEVISP